MSFLSSILNPQGATLANPPQWLSEAFGRKTASGKSVTPEGALNIIAVYACVRILAESVASLPLHIYKRTDKGKEIDYKHPLYPLLHSMPNNEMTSFDLFETLMGHTCLRGNAYSELGRDRGGRVTEIIPLNAAQVTVIRKNDGALAYEVADPQKPRTLDTENVWRISGLSSNGLVGFSPITLARESLGVSIATEEHAAKLFSNSAKPGGILSHPGRLSPEAKIKLRDSFEEHHAGSDSAHKVAVFEEGLQWTQVGMTSEDSQFLQTRKFQRGEIATLFNIPPHMIGDLEKASFSNIEQQSLDFVVKTLRPWLTRIEKTITRDLLTPRERLTHFAEFSVEGMLRGDTKSRYEAYGKSIVDGWMSRNEVRKLENRNPVDGLDEYLTPLNMTNGTTEEP